MGKGQDPRQLNKFLAYVLGRRPDEFGLVPDESGCVKIKDLLKALGEEDGWRHVRRAHINEVLLTLDKPAVAIDGPMIRAEDRHLMPLPAPAAHLPKLLYTCVRQRAYPHVRQKGLMPSDRDGIVCSASPEMAMRIGRRTDRDPVQMTVLVAACRQSGVAFQAVGEDLYLANFIPVGGFTGPPLPKEKPEAAKQPKKSAAVVDKTPGSFPLKPRPEFEKTEKTKKQRRKKEIAWKKGRRQMNKLR